MIYIDLLDFLRDIFEVLAVDVGKLGAAWAELA
jgi:hypothetical protein